MANDKPPMISVVCAWYNRADEILKTIDSLLAQEFSSFEIIVVNDGSSDTRVKTILDSYNDSRLIIVHHENVGFVGAIRKAIDISRAPFIAIQGAGDFSYPTRLGVQADFLMKNPEFGLVGCLYQNVVVGGAGDGRKSGLNKHRVEIKLYDFLHGRNPYSHGEVMLRRSIYDQVGGYRPFFRFAQDKDLWIRMVENSKAGMINELLYERRIFISDGVSSDRNKIFLQIALAGFSMQCYYDRKLMGADFVDLYGQHAGVFRRPTKYFSKFLARQSVEALISGNQELAIRIAKLALLEYKTIYSFAAFYFVKLSVATKGWAHVPLLILLKKHKNFDIWMAKK